MIRSPKTKIDSFLKKGVNVFEIGVGNTLDYRIGIDGGGHKMATRRYSSSLLVVCFPDKAELQAQIESYIAISRKPSIRRFVDWAKSNGMLIEIVRPAQIDF